MKKLFYLLLALGLSSQVYSAGFTFRDLLNHENITGDETKKINDVFIESQIRAIKNTYMTKPLDEWTENNYQGFAWFYIMSPIVVRQELQPLLRQIVERAIGQIAHDNTQVLDIIKKDQWR